MPSSTLWAVAQALVAELPLPGVAAPAAGGGATAAVPAVLMGVEARIALAARQFARVREASAARAASAELPAATYSYSPARCKKSRAKRDSCDVCPCFHIQVVLVLPESNVVRVRAADLTPGSPDMRSSTWRKICAERSAS